ncbi:hypothetical protein [Metapseudomonas otitidis]|uniref:hypothetical protein n=1 Tax=Metapseudomonas otitidis TaxID=319939 RepID=UPI0013F64A62|nr:hypothetical protein [Pseudomonas otitidis]
MSLELYNLHDIDFSKGVEADLFISSAPQEQRAFKVLDVQIKRSQLCWYVGPVDSQRPQIAQDFPPTQFIELEELPLMLETWLSSKKESAPTICIDVSCMPHSLMTCIARSICLLAESRAISLVVGYVIAEFSPPPKILPPNEDIKPVDEFFAGWPSNASAATSLILGLGYEREKAEGACEYFDASDTWVFFPKSPIGEYDQAVQANNNELLERLDRKHRVLSYCVDSPSNAFGQLVGLVLSIMPRSNPVILPFGPKIFFMLSLLVAAIYKEVGVWHVTGDGSPAGHNQSASDFLIGFHAKFGPAEAED